MQNVPLDFQQLSFFPKGKKSLLKRQIAVISTPRPQLTSNTGTGKSLVLVC